MIQVEPAPARALLFSPPRAGSSSWESILPGLQQGGAAFRRCLVMQECDLVIWISYQNALNTSACEKVKKYRAAAEECRATFCPLIVTVGGIDHQSMAEASPNGHQLGVCPRAVRAHQGGGSADQGPQKEVEELRV